ncbi:MAG: multidrug efflux SMR transporter [Bdellovibrionaceae bacterium]|nr:multidrug efflux SMR transporter [Pseudobdellovibrionaceae bacterium]
MNWVLLIAAGVAEIFYAVAMPKTQGFTKLLPSLFCLVFIGISMYLLSLATRTIPIGTAYAVWVGIGAVGTATFGILFLGEDKSVLRIVCILMIVVGVIGLKVFDRA